uniref:Uncharacterized protein AlNc14C21G2133 n=1 Tax=Albugo laibachii Nc14 TaxID=890382 RepID=F0W5G7_9STRA|nr:conserved hypothetical protein [Albugo laibachii Nc14]|eukprot:CCA16358.1 conserved hypothetical protein [Albugo laibachii Nc14]
MMSAYWMGVLHASVLLLPLSFGILYISWRDSRKRVKPIIGAFIKELFLYEVVLVAGSELKSLQDRLQQIPAVEKQKLKSYETRLLNVASLLQEKLRHFTSILTLLDTQSKLVLQETEREEADDSTKKEQ